MRSRFKGAAFALVAASAVLPAVPAHASTVSVTYNYVYFSYGPHTRQPRTLGANGGFNSIATQSGGQQSTGNTFQPGQLPSTETVGQGKFDFAFVTITGGSAMANGPTVGVTSTNPAAPPQVVVGTQNITVLAVYVPVGGGGGGNGTGATIDSFDETTGSLFNDTFVSVLPDAGGVTTNANVNGFVDTTNTAETITALSPTQPTGVNFSRWVQLVPQQAVTPNGNQMAVGKGVSTIALAFYDAPLPKVVSACQQELDSLNQITQNRGPLLLTTQFNKIKADLQKCVLQHQLTQGEVTAAENAYQAMLNSRNNPPHIPQLPH
jgi:hypothetical protein